MATSRSAAFAHLLGLARTSGAIAKRGPRRAPITDWQAEKSAPSPAALAEAERDREMEELNGTGILAAARRRERARCAAIFASPQASENFALTASLAFDTTLTAREAIAFLASQSTRPSARRGPTNPRTIADSWGRAFDAAASEKDGRAERNPPTH